ncbi:MAG: aspartate kinase [Parcubacteria bacterium C7867-001]|nr:MAG: aspartate kinase [Parcubacteria bacterium C7867-001]
MSRIVVAKFGGSSLASGKEVQRALSIIREEPDRRYIVVSAPGRLSKDDVKVTDLLIKAHAASGRARAQALKEVGNRFTSIAAEVGVPFDTKSYLEKIEQRINSNLFRNQYDFLVSRGEYLMGRLLADALGYEFLDPMRFIRLTQDGTFSLKATQSAFARITFPERAVIPGFYGASSSGWIKTFPRNGSDISGAIVARLVNADIYENWTDTDGVCAADPRLVPFPKRIEVMTRQEMAELAYRGASVLHGAALAPLKDRGTVINIRNSRNPMHPGTQVVPETRELPRNRNPVVGIAGKKDFSVLTVTKQGMSEEVGFLGKLFTVFGTYNVNITSTPGGIEGQTAIFEDDQIQPIKDQLLAAITRVTKPDSLELERRSLAFICIVGETMKHRHGIAAKALKALSSKDVNVRVIDQGASEISIMIGVDNADYEKAIQQLSVTFKLTET